MGNLKLDDDLDLAFEDNNLVVLEDGSIDDIAQRVESSLRLFLGEWFLDVTVGVPYFGEILKANPKLSSMEALFVQTILSVEGVNRIVSLELDYDRPNRQLSVDFIADTDAGALESNIQL